MSNVSILVQPGQIFHVYSASTVLVLDGVRVGGDTAGQKTFCGLPPRDCVDVSMVHDRRFWGQEGTAMCVGCALTLKRRPRRSGMRG